MQKLIISSFLCLVSIATMAQQLTQSTTLSNPPVNIVVAEPNAVTRLDQCAEFKESAETYEKKAVDKSIYSEKYLLISQNFQKMYQQCRQETQSIQQRYQGYRSNAIQQRQIDMQQIKR